MLRRISRKSSALKIQLLGDFRVIAGPRTIERAAWRLRKAGHIVKLLALASHHRLHRERLLDVLWPELPPDSAANNLRVTLHAARHILDDRAPASMIETQQDLVVLSPSSPLEVDVALFEEAAALAQRDSNPALYRAATGLYGGDLLPDDPYEDWAIERRTALRTTYLRLLLRLGQLLEERGQHANAIATFMQALETDQTTEAAHRGLMRVYAASGEREQALRQFRRVEAILHAEVDAEPDQETVRLYRAIEAGVAITPAQAGLRGAAMVPRSRPGKVTPQPADLPEQRTTFVGRKSELEAIPDRIAAARLLTLTGPGGIGKTRLALRAVSRMSPAFETAHVVELAAVQDPNLVPQAVATALGIHDQGGRPPMERIVESLSGVTTILLLDNCEHLIDACARLADTLLDRCPNLSVLATSRQPLGVPGESVIRVPPMAIPEGPDGAPIEDVDAVHLFLDRARLADPALALDESNTASIAAICRATDGIPLAIELAAARVHAVGLEQLATRLSDSISVLRAGPRTVDARHQSLEAALDWSHALLSDDERRVFRRLAVFAGGWSLDAAEAICQVDERSGDTVIDALFQLVDKSLVLVEEEQDGVIRYRMLEPVRQYAARRLDESEETSLVQKRHCNWFTQFAERAGLELAGASHQFWLEQVEAEHDNLRAALGRSWGGGETESGLRTAAALWRFWEIRGHVREGLGWLERLLSASDAVQPNVRANAYNAAGNLAADQGDYAQSDVYYEQSLRLSREAGDQTGIARVLNNLAINASEQADFRRAERWYEQSLALSRDLGEQWRTASALNNLSAMSLYSGRYDRAEELLAESHQLWLALGDRSAYAQSLDLAGELARERGGFARAVELHDESLAIRRELGDQRHVAASLHNLATVALCQGDDERATRLAREALALRNEVGFRRGVFHSLACLAQAALRRGDVVLASQRYRESLLIRGELRSREHLDGSVIGLAAVALARDQPEHATQLLAASAAVREALGTALYRVDRDIHDQTLDQCRSALSAAAFEAAWESGADLSIDQAIDLALSSS